MLDRASHRVSIIAMIRRKWSAIFMGRYGAIPCALLLLAGCAGQEQFQEGQRLMEARQPDEAVLAFRRATSGNPWNPRYQSNLSDAESAAADKHVAQAEQDLSDHRPKEAKAELDMALEYMPGHPRAAVLMNQADAELEAAATPRPIPVAAAPPKPAPTSKPAPVETGATKSVTVVTDKKEIPPLPASIPPPAPAPAPALKPLPAEPPPAADPSPPSAFKGTISRDDRRYRKEIQTVDGITIKLSGTHTKPPRADIEVRVGKLKRDYKDLRVGTRINGRGISRAQYQLVILSVDSERETVSFSLDPVK
jgi:hypothetical protein